MSKRLFDAITVDPVRVAAIVAANWKSFKVGACLKESQNTTFRAICMETGEQVIIRVTPDAGGNETQRIEDEMHLANYLIAHNLEHVCAPIAVSAAADQFVVRDGELTLVAFRYAQGEAMNFADWKWISNVQFARTWGHWMGLLHQHTRAYAVAHPERAGRVRAWDELHDRVLAGAPLAAADVASASDAQQFGVLHGDLNISNFFWREPAAGAEFGDMWVFDWDQTQRGWFLWDLSAVLFFPYMLSRIGTWMDGSSVPGADAYQQFVGHVVAGYEAAAVGGAPVDRAALDRMVALRHEFYDRFCHRALREFDADAEYEGRCKGMRYFMKWVADWCDTDKAPLPQ